MPLPLFDLSFLIEFAVRGVKEQASLPCTHIQPAWMR
jgi:hypothetical protein